MRYFYVGAAFATLAGLSRATFTLDDVEGNDGAAERLSSAFQRKQATASKYNDDNFLYLDNGVIRVGVDKSRGGALGYLSLSGSFQNLLNPHDYGRLVQGSFYSGPDPFDTPTKQCDGSSWDPWPWNPIGGGGK